MEVSLVFIGFVVLGVVSRLSRQAPVCAARRWEAAIARWSSIELRRIRRAISEARALCSARKGKLLYI